MPAAFAHARVASHTPGRIRIRLEPSSREREMVSHIQQHLETRSGVIQVQANAATGSVVVHYDRQSSSGSEALAALRDVGIILHDMAESPAESLPAAGPGRSESAVTVVDAVSDLDRRLSAMTGRKVDLKLLFPLSLGALGLRQVLTDGWGLTEVPAYILLWYAFDSFWKFHREPAGQIDRSGGLPGTDTTPSTAE